MPKGNRSTKQLYTVVTRSKVTFRHEGRINASALPEARSGWEAKGAGVLRGSGKAVWTWPRVGATDAGLMQIQLREGVSLRCAETVLSGATHDAARPESYLGGKSIARLQESPLIHIRLKQFIQENSVPLASGTFL